MHMTAPHFIGKKTLGLFSLAVILVCSPLVFMGILSFFQAGGITLIFVGMFITIEFLAQRHYRQAHLLLRRLDELVNIAESSDPELPGTFTKDEEQKVKCDPRGRTAVLLVNGFNGLGLHTLFSVIRLFGSAFKNFVFLQIGVLDERSIKDPGEVFHKTNEVTADLDRYVKYMRRHGYYAVSYPACGTTIVDEIVRITPKILDQYPNAVFFGGQLVFPNTALLSGLFHNYTIFAIQKRFYRQGIPVVILPIRV
jgi:hypothetical protein